VPGGIRKEISAGQAARILEQVRPSDAIVKARCELAAEFVEDIRRLDAQLREANKKLAAAVRASGTSLTGIFGVGPVIAGTVIGDVRQVFRLPSRDHFAASNGTAPVEVSSGDRKRACRLSLRGNRRLNHAIHMAAISQIRHKHSDGRAYYDKKLAEGKTHKEALRCLKRRISDAIYAALVADARRAAALRPQGPGGQPGDDSASSAAGSHPAHRLFGQATPGPATTIRPAHSPGGRAGHSSIAATQPPAKPQVQVERPQRSEDERPGGAARRRPHSAARKAPREIPNSPLKPRLQK
jgi:transposase